MTAAILGLKIFLPANYGMALRLGVLVISGGLTYILVAGGLSYSRRHVLQRAINLLRNRGAADPS
jgi:hypothetical protein